MEVQVVFLHMYRNVLKHVLYRTAIQHCYVSSNETKNYQGDNTVSVQHCVINYEIDTYKFR